MHIMKFFNLISILDKSEDVEKVRSRQKIRKFCQTMMNDNNLKDKPIYLFATLVDINKSDDKYIDESLKVRYVILHIL